MISEYNKINKKSIAKQKYNLIKNIKNNYILENFFRTKVPTYKVNASIWRILEGNGINPAKTVASRYFLIENIINKKVNKKQINEISNELNKHDKDLRLLSYNILLEKFNNKYGKSLSANQKRLLKEYIENISNTDNMRKFIIKEVDMLTKVISLLSNKVADKIVKIKLLEVNSQLNRMKKLNSINEVHVLSCMRSYSLIKELKNVTK